MLAACFVIVGQPAKLEGRDEIPIDVDIVSLQEIVPSDPPSAPSVNEADGPEQEKPAEPTDRKPSRNDDPPGMAEPEQAPPPDPLDLKSEEEPSASNRPAEASETPPKPEELAEPAAPAEELPLTAAMEEERAPAKVEPIVPLPKPRPSREVTNEQPLRKTEKPVRDAPSKTADRKASTAKETRTSAERPTSTSSSANDQGGAGARRARASGNASISNYLGLVAARLQSQKRYPDAARRRRLSGTAHISFTINGSGAVTSSRIVRSSGEPLLDREVAAMLQRASPFPPMPDTATGDSITVTVPVRFQMR